MQFQAFSHLSANLHDRIQRCHRFLKDHRHILALDLAALLTAHAQKFLTIQLNGALRYLRFFTKQSHHCKRCHGLTGTGFTNDSDDFSFSHLKIDMIHNCVYATLCWKTNGQILDF